MKKCWLVVLGFALLFALVFSGFGCQAGGHGCGGCGDVGHSAPPSRQPERQPEVAQAVYSCPMHPEVTADRPGKCPKCGMDLVRRR